MNGKRMRYLMGLIGMVVILSVALLIRWFQDQHDLMPTRREMEDYMRLAYKQPIPVHFPDVDPPPVPDEHSDEWQVAEDELVRWKLNNTLQDLYGGRIAYS